MDGHKCMDKGNFHNSCISDNVVGAIGNKLVRLYYKSFSRVLLGKQKIKLWISYLWQLSARAIRPQSSILLQLASTCVRNLQRLVTCRSNRSPERCPRWQPVKFSSCKSNIKYTYTWYTAYTHTSNTMGYHGYA